LIRVEIGWSELATRRSVGELSLTGDDAATKQWKVCAVTLKIWFSGVETTLHNNEIGWQDTVRS
jgi:hypothetical protein